MNKRGQFFIIAAIIIISAIAGLTGIANYARGGEEQKAFYDLTEEVGYESKRALDWGTFNEQNLDPLIREFLANYSDYIDKNEVIFIYETDSEIFQGQSQFQALVFENQGIGGVSLNTGSNRGIEIDRRTGRTADVELVLQGKDKENKAVVVVENASYDFDIREANFFFVIAKEEEGERFVSRG